MFLITLASLITAVVLEIPFLAGIPFIVILLWISIVNFKLLFFILTAFIPLSTEIYLPGGLGTDLPTEPIMVLLMIVFLFHLLLSKSFSIDKLFINHHLIWLLLFHFIWIAVTCIYSYDFVISLKFLLAKAWYIIVFVFVAAFVLENKEDIKIFFWCLFIPSFLIVLQSIIRHYGYHFSFSDVNKCVTPFFRNHVNYAAYLALFIPFIWMARSWYNKGTYGRILLNIALLVFGIAVYLSYTRSAWICIVAMIGMYFIIEYRLIKWALFTFAIGLTLFLSYLLSENRYLTFAPDYTKTIYHEKLDEHLESTYKLEDLSTAERFYRWVAAKQMSTENPLTGFGPGNFYHHYKKFAVSRFTTYVSDNPEKSGVHNYFLMLAVEQGYIGVIIFIILSIYLFTKSEQVYHQTKDKGSRLIMISVILSLTSIYVMNFFSDLIETDKVGAFFFIYLTLIIKQDISNLLIKPSGIK